jgi:dipeptidyl aminopeptidase/acylaminoacyl peptidase
MTSDPDSRQRVPARIVCAALILSIAYSMSACRAVGLGHVARNVEPFTFQVAAGKDQYQIEAYLARTAMPGRRPALLVLNAGEGNAQRCIDASGSLTALGIQVACVSIPGYGRSSGPGRFVGPQAVAAAHRALDILASRPDVDPSRLGVWGQSDGAVAAGLLMDSDPRPRAVVLQSGAYDTVGLWPEAPWTTKLSILRQVWPSKRVLKERSVIEHLPRRLDCSVLILHGERDRRTPVDQAERLEHALKARGAKVETRYFAKAPHLLGTRVERPVEQFLRETLLLDTSSVPS